MKLKDFFKFMKRQWGTPAVRKDIEVRYSALPSMLAFIWHWLTHVKYYYANAGTFLNADHFAHDREWEVVRAVENIWVYAINDFLKPYLTHPDSVVLKYYKELRSAAGDINFVTDYQYIINGVDTKDHPFTSLVYIMLLAGDISQHQWSHLVQLSHRLDYDYQAGRLLAPKCLPNHFVLPTEYMHPVEPTEVQKVWLEWVYVVGTAKLTGKQEHAGDSILKRLERAAALDAGNIEA